ncbi:MAG: 50S ribosomal protein L24 [DPANN group archaeon]|nr:50S ribosomal protein L24 [DPANN group archaeon]
MKWSNKWKSSKNPTKQRNYVANAPLHIKRNMLKANLSKEIQKDTTRRTFGIKCGDDVIIKRGDFKGQMGEVLTTNVKKSTVTIKGIVKNKVNGTEYHVPTKASNLVITKLNLNDKLRVASLNKKNKKTKETTKDTKDIKKTSKFREENVSETKPKSEKKVEITK